MPISAEDVDRAVADEAEMQGELAAQEGALAPVAPLPAVKMELADWHKLDTPEWDATKFKVRHLEDFLASLPQAPTESIPESLVVGQATRETEAPRIGPGAKMQGPHGTPSEGDAESPPEANEREVRYAWLLSLSCPSEETIKEKKLKKPGEFTRYQILKAVLAAVAKSNERSAPHNRQAHMTAPLDSIAQ